MQEVLSQRDIERLVYGFLNKYGKRYSNDNFYIGEMITEANLALLKYDTSISKSPSTLIYTFCKNRMLNLLRDEKKYYGRHYFPKNMLHIPVKVERPYDRITMEEAKNLVNNSGLSKRCKEVVLCKLEHPTEILEELGSRLGISMAAVSLHIISAEQYFKRHDIRISFKEEE